jgi:hypothetical protein
MSLTRRTFLRRGSVAALFVGLSLPSLVTALAQNAGSGAPSNRSNEYFTVPQEAKRDRVFYFNKSTFEPHLDTDFVVEGGFNTTTLRLVEIEDCGEPKRDGECFSLMFRADRELTDVRTIHVFEHAALGKFNLFVSPTKKLSESRSLYYVAVINRQN